MGLGLFNSESYSGYVTSTTPNLYEAEFADGVQMRTQKTVCTRLKVQFGIAWNGDVNASNQWHASYGAQFAPGDWLEFMPSGNPGYANAAAALTAYNLGRMKPGRCCEQVSSRHRYCY